MASKLSAPIAQSHTRSPSTYGLLRSGQVPLYLSCALPREHRTTFEVHCQRSQPCTRLSARFSNVPQTLQNSGKVAGAATIGQRFKAVQRRQARVEGQGSSAAESEGLTYDHLLLAILDPNPYLSDGSKLACQTAAGLAHLHKSKVTVLLADAKEPTGDQSVRLDIITQQLKDRGCDDFEILETTTTNPSVAVGDVADEVEADLLVLSSEAVHAKTVDANLLAEFVPCPFLLLP